jgi:aspartate racemase
MSRRIVIIGGMGPQASLELHQRIIAGAAEAGARDNEDYPEIVHFSIPLVDFISSGDSKPGLQQLKRALDTMKFCNDDNVVLACNTAHVLLSEIESYCGLPFVSLIDTAVASVAPMSASVGILASSTTIKTQLYERPLVQSGRDVVLPSRKETAEIEQAIRHIIANGSADDVRIAVEPIMQRMIRAGADQIMLGCTELSVIFRGASDTLVIDPLTAVCNHLLKKEAV